MGMLTDGNTVAGNTCVEQGRWVHQAATLSENYFQPLPWACLNCGRHRLGDSRLEILGE